MKRCPVCDLLNLDDAPLCNSCSNPFPPNNKKGPLKTVRWHILSLLLVLGMMALLKYRGGDLFADMGRVISAPSPGQVEIFSVRIYADLTQAAVVEGKLRNISPTDLSDLDLEVIVYDARDKELGLHHHPINSLPKGKFTPFLVKVPPYEDIDHAHFSLHDRSKKELYLINRVVEKSPH